MDPFQLNLGVRGFLASYVDWIGKFRVSLSKGRREKNVSQADGLSRY